MYFKILLVIDFRQVFIFSNGVVVILVNAFFYRLFYDTVTIFRGMKSESFTMFRVKNEHMFFSFSSLSTNFTIFSASIVWVSNFKRYMSTFAVRIGDN